MGVTNRLVFNPTDADTIASSSSVGAYVRAGTDGDLIGSETLNSLEWLRTAGPIIDSSGNEVGVTSNALDVNIASGAIMIGSDYDEDTPHTSGDTGNFGVGIRVDDIAAVPATALAGTELDYQGFILGPQGGLKVAADQLDIDDLNATDDAVQSWLHDGAGTALTSTLISGDQALDVNVVGGDIDDDLADTAILGTQTLVSTVAINVVGSALADRKHLALANESNKTMYFGQAGVTATNGFPLHPGQQQVWRIGPSVAPQIIGRSGSSSEDIRVLELS